MLEGWLTTMEAAEYLDVSKGTIINMTRQIDPLTGKHYGTRIGPLWVFRRDELDRWKATPRHAGGRPKPDAAPMTPVVAV